MAQEVAQVAGVERGDGRAGELRDGGRPAMQPAVVKIPILFGDVMETLAQMTANGEHRFRPLEGGLADIRDEIRARVVGHHQLTDSVLLDLAIRRQGRLATFDRRILGLLPPDSVLRDALAIIPA